MSGAWHLEELCGPVRGHWEPSPLLSVCLQAEGWGAGVWWDVPGASQGIVWPGCALEGPLAAGWGVGGFGRAGLGGVYACHVAVP